MSVSVMGWAWGLPIQGNEKLVLLALADRANDDGECWPGYASLADKCSMSERNVMRIVAKLKECGLLTIEQRKNPDNGRQITNVYTLNFSYKPGDKLSPGHDEKPGDKSDKVRVTPVSPNTSGKTTTSGLEVTTLRSVTSKPPAATSKKTPEESETAICFNPEKQQFTNISPEQYAKWDDAYKRIDVDAEIEKAELWLVANPRKRKQNYLRFINGWLSRASERASQPKQAFQQRQPGQQR